MNTSLIRFVFDSTDIASLLEFAQQILQAALSTGDPVLIKQVAEFIALLG